MWKTINNIQENWDDNTITHKYIRKQSANVVNNFGMNYICGGIQIVLEFVMFE